MNIPEAAVEAAVLAIYDHRIPISEDEVRIILEAAGPHMLAKVWQEGYMCSYDQERGGNGELPIPVPEYLADDLVQWNPYRHTP